MRILAIDPGSEQSALVWYCASTRGVVLYGILPNEEVARMLPELAELADVLVLEMIASYGMPVGAEVFETCTWIGHFERAWPGARYRLFRRDVKMHLCGSARAKDSNIRQALLDRFGPGKQKAVGIKSARGPLYGIKKDLWAALAVAVTWEDQFQPPHSIDCTGGDVAA